MENQPLVSVVTPVYNGAKYLRECMDSVLAQTYPHWEYVVVDNRSTDGTREIAAAYAQRDPRIRVVTNAEFLPLIANWNHALRQIDPEAKYCKVVHADDRLYPACIAHMVALAERHPTIGIVSAHRLDEEVVGLDGLAERGGFVPGREVCRRRLAGGSDLFGSPTSILLRADLVRGRADFYDESFLHADTAVCFELLREADFGMVPEVLTYTRRHNESVTAFAKRVDTHKGESLIMLATYGPHYLAPEEYERAFRRRLRAHYRFLARSMFRLRTQRERLREFLEFHRRAMERSGVRLSVAGLMMGAADALAGKVTGRRGRDNAAVRHEVP